MSKSGNEPLSGVVAQIVTDDELIINLGSSAGVESGMIFEILDRRTMDVRDPSSQNRVIGSLKRVKAKVRINQVGDDLSLGEITPPRRPSLGQIGASLGGRRSGVLTGDVWEEGVRRGDPVVQLLPRTASS